MEMLNATKIVLAWELYESGICKVDVAKRLEVNRDTVRVWIQGVQKHSLNTFLDLYASAKKGSRPKRQIDPILKRWVWDIRERELDCCGQKINYFLEKERGVSVSIPKIYEILAEKYQIKSKWKKNQALGPVPEAQKAREVIQMDSIDFGGIFAFTAVDIFSREADVLLRPSLTSHDGLVFLETCMPRRFDGHSKLIQSDGGPEFKDEFKENVGQYTDRYRISAAYKKNEQAYIESFNRTVRKECLGWSKYHPDQITQLNYLVNTFLERYHYHRPHLGLGLRPPLTKS